MREAIGRYRITGTLGEGGMGIVYEAHDARLDRAVAVKLIRPALQADGTRERFWREARAAGALNHPNVCHIYEIAEDGDDLFIVMERLDGESLTDRLQRGALAPTDAIQVALGALAGLGTVHAQGLLHRDLKPSNVHLTPHGVKLLDFGLALPVSTSIGEQDHTRPPLTLPGMVIGTPGYMAPEQILGQPLDARTDLYAIGALLFEMLAGQPPFPAPTPAEVLGRALSERPPALGGSPIVVAADAVINRALARNPDARYPDAAAMAHDLRMALRFADSGTHVPVRALRRLIVLPFRLLRPDTEIDFLAFGLADAITASLAGNEGLVVRSSLAAARFAAATPDLSAIASEADVDLVVSGTVLRGGDEVRVTAQLVEAPRGTIIWSQAFQTRITGLFQVQDEVSTRIHASVAASLGASRAAEHAPLGRAHELFLRANQLALSPRTWSEARIRYEEAVGEDPGYAPAWARLGRLHRLLANTGTDEVAGFERADAALSRALAIDPDLPMALTYHAQLDMDLGRSREALVRLLDQAARHPSDPHLLAGLVQACRYCGLIEESIAAHVRARRLDPMLATGVVNSYWLKGDFKTALEHAEVLRDVTLGLTLAALGREDEAKAALAEDEARCGDTAEGEFCRILRETLEGRQDEPRARLAALLERRTFVDPEAHFHSARILARLESPDLAVATLARAVDGGYCALPALHIDAWLDPLRARSDFRALVDRAVVQQRAAADQFVRSGGERTLGVVR